MSSKDTAAENNVSKCRTCGATLPHESLDVLHRCEAEPGAAAPVIIERLDVFLTHPILGMLIFVLIIYAVFELTFIVGEPIMVALEHFFGRLAAVISTHWPAYGGETLKSLVVDGIIGGIGGVLIFMPNALLLFVGIAVLEETGYMARAALIMRSAMLKAGLHGKSFVPMVIGFDCSVPAILATRSIENRASRLITILILPLFSCSARYSIYALIIPAFFPYFWRGPILMIIYLLGIVLAMTGAKILSITVFKKAPPPYTAPLPAYRVPDVRVIARHIMERGWICLKKAGTTLFAGSVILWAAARYPSVDPAAIQGLTVEQAAQVKLENSLVGRVGHIMEYVLKPAGFDWKISTALLSASAGKEIFVSQMAILHACSHTKTGMETLRQHMRQTYSPLLGFCIMLFALISMPCVSTIVTTAGETGSWKWALLQLAILTFVAYVLTVAVYQIGTLLVNLAVIILASA
jgi:ferrous iron transport protein B